MTKRRKHEKAFDGLDQVIDLVLHRNNLIGEASPGRQKNKLELSHFCKWSCGMQASWHAAPG